VSSDCFVTGVGVLPFQLDGDRSFEDMALDAARLALADAGVDLGDVTALVVGSRYAHPGAGQRVTALVGGLRVPVYNIENACSSGTTAFALASRLVAADPDEIVLVIGADETATVGRGGVTLPDADYAGAAGVTHPAAYAMKTSRYCATFGYRVDDIAAVAVKNRAHAIENPNAAFRTAVTLDEVAASPVVAEPLTLLHCTANANGAAAAVLAAAPGGASCAPPVRVAAAEHAAGPLADRFASATEAVACRAFRRAGCGPDEIDVAEVYDAFTIAEVAAYEDLGFCERGEGARHVSQMRLGERLPVNVSGGALGRGHPMGATGLAQVAEVVTQLRGAAGPRQVHGARRGLVHTLGGNLRVLTSNVASVVILEAT
jgi:acetyl-CoA acetyltransferase